MKIERLVVGQLSTNCYLVWEEKSKEAIIVDPGDDADYIIRKTQDLNLKPRLVVATHGHFDHILGVTELKLALNIPFIIHKKDLFLVKQSSRSAKHFLKNEADPVAPPDGFIKEGEIVKIGKEELRVMETPGHTPGGMSLLGERLVFTGDTLFADGVGRTDFSYSSKKDLDASLEKLSKLPDSSLVYPGHGEETTIAEAFRK